MRRKDRLAEIELFVDYFGFNPTKWYKRKLNDYHRDMLAESMMVRGKYVDWSGKPLEGTITMTLDEDGSFKTVLPNNTLDFF